MPLYDLQVSLFHTLFHKSDYQDCIESQPSEVENKTERFLTPYWTDWRNKSNFDLLPFPVPKFQGLFADSSLGCLNLLVSNFRSFCLSLSNARIPDMHHHTQLVCLWSLETGSNSIAQAGLKLMVILMVILLPQFLLFCCFVLYLYFWDKDSLRNSGCLELSLQIRKDLN